MQKICLVVLIGLPAAGKTIFSQELNQKLSHNNSEYQCHIVTYDNIIDKKIYESIKTNVTSFQDQYKELRNQAFTSVEDIIKSAISNNFKKHVIVIDDNMYYKSMRYQYYKLAKKYKTSFLQIYVHVLLDVALVRNSTREENLQVPEAVIRVMAKKLEAPGKEHWELNSITLDSNCLLSETTFKIVLETLNKCMEVHTVYTHVGKKTGTLPVTELQRIDLLLRKIVHEKLSEDRSQAEMYIRKKKEIFQKIKNCNIAIGAEWSEAKMYNYLENLF